MRESQQRGGMDKIFNIIFSVEVKGKPPLRSIDISCTREKFAISVYCVLDKVALSIAKLTLYMTNCNCPIDNKCNSAASHLHGFISNFM